jgi:DNA-binding MarR family transcriptional regulator
MPPEASLSKRLSACAALRHGAAMATHSKTKPAEAETQWSFLPDLLGYHLRRAQVAMFQDFAATLNGAEITPGQFGVLALIEANEGLSQTQLARILGIDRSTLVGVLDKLEARGLIERGARPDDRRSHALALSRAGKTRFRLLAKKVRQHEARMAKKLSPSERSALIALLQRIG